MEVQDRFQTGIRTSYRNALGVGDSTLFWVDPKNQLTAVLLVQLIPFDKIGLHRTFRRAVYDALAPT